MAILLEVKLSVGRSCVDKPGAAGGRYMVAVQEWPRRLLREQRVCIGTA